MSPKDIDSLPLQELVDLLVKNTMELIELREKGGVNSIVLYNKRSDVKMIQLAIENNVYEKAAYSHAESQGYLASSIYIL